MKCKNVFFSPPGYLLVTLFASHAATSFVVPASFSPKPTRFKASEYDLDLSGVDFSAPPTSTETKKRGRAKKLTTASPLPTTEDDVKRSENLAAAQKKDQPRPRIKGRTKKESSPITEEPKTRKTEGGRNKRKEKSAPAMEGDKPKPRNKSKQKVGNKVNVDAEETKTAETKDKKNKRNKNPSLAPVQDTPRPRNKGSEEPKTANVDRRSKKARRRESEAPEPNTKGRTKGVAQTQVAQGSRRKREKGTAAVKPPVTATPVTAPVGPAVLSAVSFGGLAAVRSQLEKTKELRSEMQSRKPTVRTAAKKSRTKSMQVVPKKTAGGTRGIKSAKKIAPKKSSGTLVPGGKPEKDSSAVVVGGGLALAAAILIALSPGPEDVGVSTSKPPPAKEDTIIVAPAKIETKPPTLEVVVDAPSPAEQRTPVVATPGATETPKPDAPKEVTVDATQQATKYQVEEAGSAQRDGQAQGFFKFETIQVQLLVALAAVASLGVLFKTEVPTSEENAKDTEKIPEDLNEEKITSDGGSSTVEGGEQESDESESRNTGGSAEEGDSVGDSASTDEAKDQQVGDSGEEKKE